MSKSRPSTLENAGYIQWPTSAIAARPPMNMSGPACVAVSSAFGMTRKRGVKAGLAERTASEGRVIGAASADGKTAALVEINCNTDFTAKSEPFLKLGEVAANE